MNGKEIQNEEVLRYEWRERVESDPVALHAAISELMEDIGLVPESDEMQQPQFSLHEKTPNQAIEDGDLVAVFHLLLHWQAIMELNDSY